MYELNSESAPPTATSRSTSPKSFAALLFGAIVICGAILVRTLYRGPDSSAVESMDLGGLSGMTALTMGIAQEQRRGAAVEAVPPLPPNGNGAKTTAVRRKD